ncbi:GNAT family N-acetyltransferase [Bowmanella sp. Y26]|uniref:GNAT family N-acetyltransferase n=1 Tax=Bowmanella yangjiangensis TaxID=2811230 RepID=UPI001BDDC98E|nr:GNAT family N-acetyltransferase [Bowmanella yangjiangensis]MBT1064203.1 GNAT family N-acetyltransferase [Bowmanella yangjiangensis]
MAAIGSDLLPRYDGNAISLFTPPMQLTTPRLSLRLLTDEDAGFILELLNDPGFLQYIGDKNVRSLDDARRHIQEGPLAMYQNKGFCLLRVGLKESDDAIGLCGLLKRDYLDHPDLGYAFLPKGRGAGYASEAIQAVLEHATAKGLNTLMAYCQADNSASIRQLEKAGFLSLGPYQLEGSTDNLILFQRTAGY